MNLSDKKLVFVTGKGGVGKSVCAAAIAWREARKGRKVFLFELGSQSFYEAFFQTRGIGYEPSEVVPDVHISLLSPESALREYVLHFVRVPKLYDVLFHNKVIKSFLNATPALPEISILGKLTSEIRGIFPAEYDVFVVDCFSTGHALALLRAPKGLTGAFRAGPLYEQSHQIDLVLHDSTQTHFVLVTLAEEMPVVETSEMFETLKTEFKGSVSLICNMLLDPPLTRQEQSQLFSEVKDENVHEFLEFLKVREEIQTQQLENLKTLTPTIYGVPQILDATYGQDYIEKVSKHLDEPWILRTS